MPASRAVLADIRDLKLDPTKAHSGDAKTGRLKGAGTVSKKQVTKAPVEEKVVPSVEKVKVVEKIEEKTEEKFEEKLSDVVDDKQSQKGKLGKKPKRGDDESGEQA